MSSSPKARTSGWVWRQDRIAIAPDGDGMAVCVLDSATVYRLSEFGALIWDLLGDEPMLIGDLVAQLLPQTELDDAELTDALLPVLDQLHDNGLVELR